MATSSTSPLATLTTKAPAIPTSKYGNSGHQVVLPLRLFPLVPQHLSNRQDREATTNATEDDNEDANADEDLDVNEDDSGVEAMSEAEEAEEEEVDSDETLLLGGDSHDLM